ncbi:MAG: low molecular weight protein arginine phosphatase [Natronincolaceae bacterium]|jgi:protein-tyrosine-phosphatase|nr:low molecular weight protein arginine phosphatase [Bacillota bacterium]NLK90723.1 low molecular weight protein arginine phosphatase [Clostridiales bacterium]
MQTILFVCTGNTCRSTMAEAIFKHILANRKDGPQNIKVMSAGIYAWEGDKASYGAVEALKERGIDIMEHSSKLLTPKLLEKADLVLTMTSNHKRAVLEMCPGAREKVYTLKEYVLSHDNKELYISDSDFDWINQDIKDPYGQSVDVYRESAEELEKYLQMLIDKISSI